MFWKKWLLALLLFCGFSICMNVFMVYSGEGFSLDALHPPIQVIHPSPMETLPKGPYTYLGKGKQSIAFLSADREHVLKLFYWKRPLKRKWVHQGENWLRFSSPGWMAKLAKRRGEIYCLFTRYLWGYQDLRKETRIEGVHFFHTQTPIPVQLIDFKGKLHEVDLATYPFVVQKKVTLLREVLNTKIEKGDLEGAKDSIAKLRSFFKERIRKGYLDNPEVFVKNYGFYENSAVQIDVGKLKKFDSCDTKKEKYKIYANLDKFLRKHYSKLLEVESQADN